VMLSVYHFLDLPSGNHVRFARITRDLMFMIAR